MKGLNDVHSLTRDAKIQSQTSEVTIRRLMKEGSWKGQKKIMPRVMLTIIKNIFGKQYKLFLFCPMLSPIHLYSYSIEFTSLASIGE